MNTPTSYFRTVGGAHVTVLADGEDDQYRADCAGCGWSLTSRTVDLFAGGPLERPAGALEGIEYDANAHALGCTKMPRNLWPRDQQTGR